MTDDGLNGLENVVEHELAVGMREDELSVVLEVQRHI